MDKKQPNDIIPNPASGKRDEQELRKMRHSVRASQKMDIGMGENHYSTQAGPTLDELQSEGRRLVETIHQSTSIIKIISDKNKIIENNARYTIHGLKQQLGYTTKELSTLKLSIEEQKLKYENLKTNTEDQKVKYDKLCLDFDDLKNINEKLIRKARQLEMDVKDYAEKNLALIDELDNTKKERDAANYWLQKVGNEINSKLVMITQSAETELSYEEVKKNFDDVVKEIK